MERQGCQTSEIRNTSFLVGHFDIQTEFSRGG